MWVDALVHKCREGGRIVNVATVIATGVNVDGAREILGVDVFTTKDGAAWVAFLRHLVARYFSGVKLVMSDCHQGLKNAIAAVLPGAGWKRRRTHFVRDLLGRVPKVSQQMVATLVRSVFMQPTTQAVREQHRRVVKQLEAAGFHKAAQFLVDAAEGILAFGAFPKKHWKQVWSNNPQERVSTKRFGAAPMLLASFQTTKACWRRACQAARRVGRCKAVYGSRAIGGGTRCL